MSEEARETRRELLIAAFEGQLTWAAAVRRMRHAIGKNQEEFGRIFGLSRRRVMELETGKANPTVDTLERIGRAFGYTVGFVPKAGSVKPDR